MADTSPVMLVLVAVMAVCLVTLTVVGVVMAIEIRRTCRRLQTLVPACEHALRQVRQIGSLVQGITARIHGITQRVEGMAQAACDTASDVMQPLISFKRHAETFFARQSGNGARPGPRRAKGRSTGS